MADHNILGAPSLDLDDSDILTGYTSAPFELEELEEMLKNDPENEMLLDIAAFKYYTSRCFGQSSGQLPAFDQTQLQETALPFLLGKHLLQAQSNNRSLCRVGNCAWIGHTQRLW